MPFTKWWHSLAISFSVVTWGLAQPLYTVITGNAVFARGTGPALLLVILVYQAAPTAILFLLDRAILRLWGARGGLRAYRTALYTVATLIFLRGLQGYYASQTSFFPEGIKYGIMVALLLSVAGLAVYAYRAATLLFTYLAIASVILTGVFVYQTGLLGRAWYSPASQSASLSEAPSMDKPPIFIIVFDGLGRQVLLKNGRIDPERFPRFAELGRDSAVFTNATSNYGSTLLSITSLLTGRWFSPGDPAISPCRTVSCPDSLFHELQRAGYAADIFDERFALLRRHPQTLVAEAALWFRQQVVPEMLQIRLQRIVPPPSIGHPYSLAVWEDFLPGVSRAESPGRAYYTHVLVPRPPYEFDRQGQRHTPPPDWDADAIERDYTEQVIYVDSLLGQFTDKLKAQGLYERSVIIITGDHGARELGPLRSPRPGELSDLAPAVTLIIHGPGVQPGISNVDYQHIDFRPTLWDVLKMPPEKGLPGVSAFAPTRPDRQKLFWFYTSPAVEAREFAPSYPTLPGLGGWYVYQISSASWKFSRDVNLPTSRPGTAPGR